MTREDDGADETSDLPLRGHRPRRVVLAEDLAEHAASFIELLGRLRPQWTVCSVARNPEQLMQAIDDHVPDLLFLDVHLIGGTSMHALQRLPYPMPIVFISGDPSFAIEAFEHQATDYLLKPVRPSRLQRALRRVEALDRPADVPATGPARWFTARQGDASVVVRHDEVLYLQAQAKYTRVVMRDGEALIPRGLGKVEQYLPENRFVRIHRSTVVNIDHAGTLQRDDIGRLRLQMRGRSEWLHVSQAYERHFKTP